MSPNADLICASVVGSVQHIEAALNAGAEDINRAFEKAAEYGHLEACQYICKRCPSTWSRNMALVMASQNGHVPCVRWLIEIGCKTTDWSLEAALRNGHLSVCRILVDAGAAPHEMLMAVAASTGIIALCKWLQSTYPISYDWDAALRLAAQSGSLTACHYCLRNGASDVESALVAAAGRGHVAVCSMFADEFSLSCWDKALVAAAWGGHASAFDFCMSKGATNIVGALEAAQVRRHRELERHIVCQLRRADVEFMYSHHSVSIDADASA